jgi:hypothetical protein
MYNIVQDTIEGMNPPTAADHLMGALGQLVQMKLAKSMNLLDAISLFQIPKNHMNESCFLFSLASALRFWAKIKPFF